MVNNITSSNSLILSKTKRNDIALVKLETSPVIGRSQDPFHPIKPVALPSNQTDPTNHVCKVSGWGTLKYHGFEEHHLLRKAEVLVHSRETCAKMLHKYKFW